MSDPIVVPFGSEQKNRKSDELIAGHWLCFGQDKRAWRNGGKLCWEATCQGISKSGKLGKEPCRGISIPRIILKFWTIIQVALLCLKKSNITAVDIFFGRQTDD
jgi:hypothetical protein